MKKVKYAEYNQVYVWELPVRFFHWINVVCILVLAVTGYIIGKPLAIQSSSEASFQYWFGIVRFLHFAFAYVFVFSLIGRVYWGFMGNRFIRWSNFIPHTRRQWKETWDVLCLDVLQICKLPIQSTGPNALAGIIYTLVYLVLLFQIITGFGLYAAMSKSWFPQLFAWIVPVMGGNFAVRQWHHVMTWFIAAFAILHVYLSWYHDYIEGRGTMSSIIGGWKFIEKIPGR